jgi:hypothetical protein
VRVAAAEALFGRELTVDQKRNGVQLIIDLVKSNPERYGNLSSLVLNELADNASNENTHEIGAMALDKRYGPLRLALIEALKQIGSNQAIPYLRQLAREPIVAAPALSGLAKLKDPETVSLCEAALEAAELTSESKKDVRRILGRIKRRRRVKEGPIHLTQDPVPDCLPEWSTNVDGSDIEKALWAIRKSTDKGFTNTEASEVMSVVDNLAIGVGSTFRFDVVFAGSLQQMWLKIDCDDEESFEIYVYASQELIRRIRIEAKALLKETT